jgi:hypothetical protein
MFGHTLSDLLFGAWVVVIIVWVIVELRRK